MKKDKILTYSMIGFYCLWCMLEIYMIFSIIQPTALKIKYGTAISSTIESDVNIPTITSGKYIENTAPMKTPAVVP